jgi:hypothetical protein
MHFNIAPRDLQRASNNLTVPGVLKYGHNGECYFENQALHYLCRPLELEKLSPRDFFENYYVINISIAKRLKKGQPDMGFIINTGHFQHPSAKETGRNTSLCREGVAERAEPLFIKVAQWTFPDTESFKENILTCAFSEINDAIEQYAEWLLLLFQSYRSIQDLCPACLQHDSFL